MSPPPPIWQSPMRTPVCRYGHPLIDIRDRSQIIDYRADGHLFQTCRVCSPHTHGFGVASKYHGLITFYALTPADLAMCLALPVTIETFDILVLLRYANAA